MNELVDDVGFDESLLPELCISSDNRRNRPEGSGCLMVQWLASDLFVMHQLAGVEKGLHRRLDKTSAATFSTQLDTPC